MVGNNWLNAIQNEARTVAGRGGGEAYLVSDAGSEKRLGRKNKRRKKREKKRWDEQKRKQNGMAGHKMSIGPPLKSRTLLS